MGGAVVGAGGDCDRYKHRFSVRFGRVYAVVNEKIWWNDNFAYSISLETVISGFRNQEAIMA
jgi:hypothetical protein